MQINYNIIIPEPPNSPIGWNSTGKFRQKVFKYPFYWYVKRNGKIFARISNLPAKASIKLLIPFMIFKMRKYWLFFRNHLYLMHNNWVVGVWVYSGHVNPQHFHIPYQSTQSVIATSVMDATSKRTWYPLPWANNANEYVGTIGRWIQISRCQFRNNIVLLVTYRINPPNYQVCCPLQVNSNISLKRLICCPSNSYAFFSEILLFLDYSSS